MRTGFTLIELLVVIAILALLVGLMVAGAVPLRTVARRNATAAICQGVQQALLVHSAAVGGQIEPAEHPLAASREPRAAFVRASGEALSASGEALRGVPVSRLPIAFQSRLLLADDRCAEAGMPHLYGMARSQLGVLGAALTEVTNFRLLPHGSGVIADPSTVGRVVAPIADGPAASELVAIALGTAGAGGELSKTKALWVAPDDAVANRLHNGRVYRVSDAIPGSVKVSGTRYRLRGTAVYDAWGNEILYALGEKDAVRLISAGRDGHFRFQPGPSGFTTPATADAPTGDDLDAARDNLSIGP